MKGPEFFSNPKIPPSLLVIKTHGGCLLPLDQVVSLALDNGLLVSLEPIQLVEPTAIVIKVSLIPAMNSPKVGHTSCVPLPSASEANGASAWSSCFANTFTPLETIVV